MRKYETPTLPITLMYGDGTVASDLVFDWLLFTLTDGVTLIEKRVDYSEVEEGKFNVRFTQEETGSLENKTIEMQINILVNDERIPTNIKRGKLERNLHNEVIFNE